MIGFRWAAALVAATAVTALLTGCEPMPTGVAGAAPTTEASSAAPSKQQTPKASATSTPKAGSSATPKAQAETFAADGRAEAG